MILALTNQWRVFKFCQRLTLSRDTIFIKLRLYFSWSLWPIPLADPFGWLLLLMAFSLASCFGQFFHPIPLANCFGQLLLADCFGQLLVPLVILWCLPDTIVAQCPGNFLTRLIQFQSHFLTRLIQFQSTQIHCTVSVRPWELRSPITKIRIVSLQFDG